MMGRESWRVGNIRQVEVRNGGKAWGVFLYAVNGERTGDEKCVGGLAGR